MHVKFIYILGDSKKPKAWSKYTTESTAYKKANSSNEIVQEKKQSKLKKVDNDEAVELLEKYKDDPLFDEFLQLNAPKEHGKLQNLDKNKEIAEKNDDSAIESENDEDKSEKLANQDISDMEYMKTLMGKPIEDRPKRQKMEKQIKEKKELFTLMVQMNNL